MRKILLVTVIILGLALTGCGKVRNPTGQFAVNAQQQSAGYTAVNAQNRAVAADEAPAPNQTAGRMNVNPSSGGVANINPAGGDTAKTPNTDDIPQAVNDLSNSDKAALLNEVDQELDALFSAVNDLDDVQDADLDFGWQ